MILCVAGNPSVDRLFEVEQLTVGEIHRPDGLIALPGGRGIHIAQVATILGHDAIVTGLLAGHTGRWIADTLAAEGVDGRFAWAAGGETRSSLSVADRETGRLTEFYEDGTAVSAAELRAVAAIVDSLMAEATWLALAGSLGRGAPADGYVALIGAARQAGVPVAVDARGEALGHALAAGPELIKINLDEARELLGQSIDGVDQVPGAAGEIRRRAGGSGHAVVITLGEDGMVLVDPDGVAWRGRLDARGRYPVGCGDAFLAGMLVGLERGESWARSAALAMGAAAANAELAGAARLDPARARQLASEAEVERL